MADKFSNNRDQNEKNKFSADANGNTVVNVEDNALKPTNPSGTTVNPKANGYITSSVTNTPLANGESFDTGVMDLDSYPFLATEIFSDQNGNATATWYSDAAGLVPVRTFPLPYESVDDIKILGVDRITQYLRIVYTNDSGSDQTVFHFKFRVQVEPFSGQFVPLGSFIPETALATVNRSVIMGLDVNGVYQNVKANPYGVLSTAEFQLDVALGSYPNIRIGIQSGRNTDIDTGTTPETIWNGGGSYTGFNATAAETLTVVSNNANDTAAGTGARTVRLYGLDADYNEITEDVTLNGLTPVTTTQSFLRMDTSEVLTAGSLGYNVGELTARQSSTTANIMMVMPARVNRTAILVTTVPAGKTRVFTSSQVRIARSSGAAGSANARILYRLEGGLFLPAINEEITTAIPFISPPNGYFVVPEKTDVKVEIDSVSDNNTIATGLLNWVDFDNE